MRMKRVYAALAVALLLSAAALAQQSNWQFLSPLKNARFVYVTSYDGPQYSGDILPQDRDAINSVQQAFIEAGHYTVVYSPAEADMIIAVESRASEDVLAVYDAHNWPGGTYLWRGMQKNGLSGEVPLYRQLSAALERAGG
jgi:hypothetical protein